MTDIKTGYEPDDDHTIAERLGNDIDPGSLLAAIREEAKKKVEKPDAEIRVPARPNFMFTFDTNFEFSQLQHWRKQATKRARGKAEDFDLVKFGCIVLAATNKRLIFKGTEVEYNLTSTELHEMFGTNSYFGCIKAVFGNDADIIKAGNEVIAAAGYGDEEDEDEYEDDPTMTS